MWFGQAMLLLYFNAITLFGITGYALRFGGTAERLCALILILGSVISSVIVIAFHNKWFPASHYLFALDSIALVALIIIALFSDRFWPLYMAAFQAPVVATHVASMVDHTIVTQAYALAQGFWIYPMLIVLLIATSGVRARAARQADTHR